MVKLPWLEIENLDDLWRIDLLDAWNKRFTQMHYHSECDASAVIFHHSTLKERYKCRFGTLHHLIYGFS